MGRRGNEANGRKEGKTGPYNPRHAGKGGDAMERARKLRELPTYDPRVGSGKPGDHSKTADTQCLHVGAVDLGGMMWCNGCQSWL